MAPAPDDHHGCRRRGQRQGFLASDDPLPIEGQARQRTGTDPGADQDPICFQCTPGAVGEFRRDQARLGQLRLGLQVVDPILSEQVGDASGELVGHLPASSHDPGPLEGQSLELQAEISGAIFQKPIELGVAQQRLAGDAAPVQAGPSCPVHLDASHLPAELRRPNGAHVSGGAASNHHQVVALRHGGPLEIDGWMDGVGSLGGIRWAWVGTGCNRQRPIAAATPVAGAAAAPDPGIRRPRRRRPPGDRNSGSG